jgi:ABC-type lipoprotein export system ATPase subunit
LNFPDLHIEKGENWLILGGSGTGKTTFLHLLGGILRPSQGEIYLHGTRIDQLSNAQLDHFRGQNIGIVFQKPYFATALTVEENLLLAQKLAGFKPDKSRVIHLLESLRIVGKKNRYPEQLSVGEQQRASIARALVNHPPLILADEPTSALDDSNCEQVIHLLENEANHSGASLVIVTHDNRLKNKFEKRIELEYESVDH